jgi:hypothetical protein
MSMVKQFSDSSGGPIGVAIAVAGVIAALYFLGSAAKKAVTDAAAAVGNVNKGTPYEGAGIVGTLGHATDAVTGNALSDFGSWLGGKAYDLTHPAPAATPPFVPRAIAVRSEALFFEKLMGPSVPRGK